MHVHINMSHDRAARAPSKSRAWHTSRAMDISPTTGPLTPTTCKTWGPLRLAVPPLPLGEGCDFDFYPSPVGRGATASRWVRGLFHPPADFDGILFWNFTARRSVGINRKPKRRSLPWPQVLSLPVHPHPRSRPEAAATPSRSPSSLWR